MKLRILKKVITLSFILGASTHYGHTSEQWTAEFRLRDGSTARHTPTTIHLGFMTAPLGFMTAPSITMRTNSYNGIAVKAPIILHVKNTRSQFITALIDSGLYQPAAAELRQYNQNANWTAEYSMGQNLIIHKPEGVCFINTIEELLNPGMQRKFLQTLTVNDVLLRRNFTQAEFEVEIGKIKAAAENTQVPAAPENTTRSMSPTFSEIEAEAIRARAARHFESFYQQIQDTTPSIRRNNTSTASRPTEDDFLQRATDHLLENLEALFNRNMEGLPYFPDYSQPTQFPLAAVQQEYTVQPLEEKNTVDTNATLNSLTSETNIDYEDISLKNDESNWSKTYFMKDIILKHEPNGVSYTLIKDAHLTPTAQQSLTLKGIIFETNCTKEDFEKAVKAYLLQKP